MKEIAMMSEKMRQSHSLTKHRTKKVIRMRRTNIIIQ